MAWRRWLASATLCGAVAGCQTPSTIPSIPKEPSTTTAKTTTDDPGVPRGQKPDADAVPTSFLDAKPESSSGNVIATIRATVNGVPILDQDVRAVATSTSPDEMRKALDMLIERELVLQDCNTRFGKGPNAKFLDKLKEAASREFDRQVVGKSKKKLGLKSDQEFKDYLKNAGVSLDVLRKQFEKQFIYQQYVQFRVGPALDRIGHDDIRDYFDKHPEEFENVDTVQWQDIFIAESSYPNREQARQTALQVERRMKQGEEIEKLMSLDNGDSVYRKGEGLGNKRGQVKPTEAEPVLFQLKDGETSIIETGGGYHVVRLVKRQQAGQMPFDEKIQGLIRDKLRHEALMREAKQFIKELKNQAAIEIAKD